MDQVCRLTGQHEKSYIAARDVIIVSALGARTDVRAYLGGLDHLLAGTQEFEYITPRYYGDGFVWDGTTSGWISLTATATRFLPHPRRNG